MLHAGLVHYFINMLALWFVGAAIEMSHVGWLQHHLTISAVGGAILSAIFLPEYIMVGASGYIWFHWAYLADICHELKLLFFATLSLRMERNTATQWYVVVLLDIGSTRSLD
jgi:hypothetical protein